MFSHPFVPIFDLKGIGGGSRVTSQISFDLAYVVALVMRILKWAHIRSNSQRLSFGDR